MNEQERLELEANLGSLREYASTLDEGSEARTTIEETIREGDALLAEYSAEETSAAEVETPEVEVVTPEAEAVAVAEVEVETAATPEVEVETPAVEAEATPAYAASDVQDDEDEDDGDDDDLDGISDEELQDILAEIDKGGDAPAPEPKGKGKRDYSSAEEVQAVRIAQNFNTGRSDRELRLERERLTSRVDGLVDTGRVLPAERDTVVALMYTLAGVGGDAQVKVYSSDESGRDDAVSALFDLLDSRSDLGLTKMYTSAPEQGEGEASIQVPADASVNDESAKLTQAILAFQKKQGIKDFGTAMLQYEQANKGTVKSYASSIR